MDEQIQRSVKHLVTHQDSVWDPRRGFMYPGTVIQLHKGFGAKLLRQVKP